MYEIDKRKKIFMNSSFLKAKIQTYILKQLTEIVPARLLAFFEK